MQLTIRLSATNIKNMTNGKWPSTQLFIYLLLYTKSPLNFLQTLLNWHVASYKCSRVATCHSNKIEKSGRRCSFKLVDPLILIIRFIFTGNQNLDPSFQRKYDPSVAYVLSIYPSYLRFPFVFVRFSFTSAGGEEKIIIIITRTLYDKKNIYVPSHIRILYRKKKHIHTNVPSEKEKNITCTLLDLRFENKKTQL